MFKGASSSKPRIDHIVCENTQSHSKGASLTSRAHFAEDHKSLSKFKPRDFRGRVIDQNAEYTVNKK